MPERTFSQDQINDLLRRAAELQVTSDDEEVGLTFSELEAIAAESGIPPRYLQAALEEADHGPKERSVSGHTNTHVFVDRVIPGDLSEDDWGAVVLKLRSTYTSDDGENYGMGPLYGKGVSERLGATREWRHTSPLGVTSHFSIRSSDGKQHVSFQRRVGLGSPRVEGVGYGFILALLSGIVLGGVSESIWVLLLVLAAVWAVAAPAIESLDRRWRGKALRKMEETIDELDVLIREEVTSDTAAQESESSSESVSSGRLAGRDLLDIPEAEGGRDLRAAQPARERN